MKYMGNKGLKNTKPIILIKFISKRPGLMAHQLKKKLNFISSTLKKTHTQP